jgi:hypothetical protein
VDAEVLIDGLIGADIPNHSVPNMHKHVQSNCSILDSFIGNLGVKRLNEWSLSKDDSPSIVIGWYDSVFEGVDMWYPDDNYSNQPRLYEVYLLILQRAVFVVMFGC